MRPNIASHAVLLSFFFAVTLLRIDLRLLKFSWWHLHASSAIQWSRLFKDLLTYGRNTSLNLILWSCNLQRLFVIKATQFCVHCGLQIREAGPIYKDWLSLCKIIKVIRSCNSQNWVFRPYLKTSLHNCTMRPKSFKYGISWILIPQQYFHKIFSDIVSFTHFTVTSLRIDYVLLLKFLWWHLLASSAIQLTGLDRIAH